MIQLDRERLKEEFKALLCVHTECMLVDFDDEAFANSAADIVERERARMLDPTNGQSFTSAALETADGLVWLENSNKGHD